MSYYSFGNVENEFKTEDIPLLVKLLTSFNEVEKNYQVKVVKMKNG